MTTADEVPEPSPLEALLGGLALSVLRLDAAHRVRQANASALALLDVEHEALVDQPVDRFFRLEGGADANREAGGTLLLERHDGVELTVRATRIPLADGGVWLVLDDVTEWEALRRERQWSAFYEPVTGLPNQRAFEGRLQRALHRAANDADDQVFGHVEIDDVDAVHETFGPTAADELVRQVAQALRGVLGSDAYLARLDGVRFGVLIDDGESLGTRGWAQRLRQAVARFRFRWQNEHFTLGATVGLVPVPSNQADVRQAIAAAEAAAATSRLPGEAPAGGAGSLTQTLGTGQSELGEKSAGYEDLRWLSRLHRALKRGRFELVRQAIVPALATDDDAPPLYEVLLRIMDRHGQLRPPTPYIHTAEKFHIIGSVDRWVVREALQRLARCTEPVPYGITVNISGASVSEAQFLDDVLATFDRTGVPPARVCFEITETAAVGNLRRARRFVATLRQRGCRFILDDFGSGLSSFAYLEDLDVDFLKIDGRFVLGMTGDPISRAIVHAVHQVAEAMGIETIAECVETDELRQAVADLGVGYAQGFGIHRPTVWR